MGTTEQYRFRLSEADRPKYERGDEWFTYTPDEIYALSAGQLEVYESVMEYTIAEMVNNFRRRSAKSLRAVMWITRRRAGVQEPWSTFDPQVMLADWELPTEGADVDSPPDESEPTDSQDS